jgi:hypothetical protein
MVTPPPARVCLVLLAVALVLWAGEVRAQRAPNAGLSFEQASARLGQVSDALVAAGANVRSKAALSRATRNLRLPDVSLEARQLRFEKSLELGPLNATTADWRFRPTASLALPIYTGGRIPADCKDTSITRSRSSGTASPRRRSVFRRRSHVIRRSASAREP